MKKNKKEIKPRKTFAERLAEKLNSLGTIDIGNPIDGGGGWVYVRQGDIKIEFSFDEKMENIQGIVITKDVWQVVGEETIISFEQL